MIFFDFFTQKNSSSTTYQDDDVFEDRDGTDVSDIDVSGEQSYSHALGDEERRTCLKVYIYLFF